MISNRVQERERERELNVEKEEKTSLYVSLSDIQVTELLLNQNSPSFNDLSFTHTQNKSYLPVIRFTTISFTHVSTVLLTLFTRQQIISFDHLVAYIRKKVFGGFILNHTFNSFLFTTSTCLQRLR